MTKWPFRQGIDPETIIYAFISGFPRSGELFIRDGRELLLQGNGLASRMENKRKKRKSAKVRPSKSKADHRLDLRGMIIPLTLLKITQACRKIKAGETMEIIGSDPDTRRDFLKVLGTSPCDVLQIRDEKEGYLIRLRKGEP